jgi:hypothetical protein
MLNHKIKSKISIGLYIVICSIIFYNRSDAVEIDILEYDIQFVFDTNTNKIVFNNYELILDINENDSVKLIFNLIGNTPNIFIIFNEHENKYYILNILNQNKIMKLLNNYENNNINNNIKYSHIPYYDINEIHYSNLMIFYYIKY